MECLRCGKKLVNIEVNGIVIDKCMSCGGVWCDPGEMEKIKDLDDIDPTLFDNAIEIKGNQTKNKTLRCPRCYDGGRNSGRLMMQNYMYGKEIQIDRCVDCCGVWLDRGELSKIIGSRKAIQHITTRESTIKEFLAFLRNVL